jgi:hypothetical protein
MRKSAMQNIHDMNQRGLISYANHDLQRLQNQFGTGQNTTNKKLQQPINTNNTKSSSLWDELNEGKSKQESSLRDELDKPSNVVYIKNPPVINQQLAQPQNLQLEQMLKKIEELEQSLVQVRQINEEKTNKIEEVVNKNMELQEKLLEKTEQVNVEINKYNVEHNKLVDTQHKLDTHKLKLTNFIDTHHDIDGQDQLIEMLGDLNMEE